MNPQQQKYQQLKEALELQFQKHWNVNLTDLKREYLCIDVVMKTLPNKG